MVEVVIVVREMGHLQPDYSLRFELPEIPAVGSYISIHRPTNPEPFGEDLIVRHVWWRLEHPETSGHRTGEPKLGSTKEIFIECDPALGPYSSDSWRKLHEAGHEKGIVEKFNVSRFSIRESDLKKE